MLQSFGKIGLNTSDQAMHCAGPEATVMKIQIKTLRCVIALLTLPTGERR